MIEHLEGYSSPSLITDPVIQQSLYSFIGSTLEAFSTPGSDAPGYFADPDIALSGSALGEYLTGPVATQEGIAEVANSGTLWKPRLVISWMRGDIAWAQIRINGHTEEDHRPVVVPYVVTGVFQKSGDQWTWLYWGGSEPQNPARL